MNHPHDRGERRDVRSYYISRRVKTRKRQQQNSFNHEPHEGNPGTLIAYLDYLRWQELSDDEKKIMEVEAVLDGKDPASIKPWWKPEIPGYYAKCNLGCGCRGCHYKKYYKEKRRRRRSLDYAVIDSIEN